MKHLFCFLSLLVCVNAQALPLSPQGQAEADLFNTFLAAAYAQRAASPDRIYLLRKALEKSPDSAYIKQQLVSEYVAAGQPEQAQSYTDFIDAAPNDPEAWSIYAAYQLAAGNDAQALQAYEKALEEYELAQKQIQQLSREQKKDIVLEDYEFFVCNLATLTPTEYRIYELYLEGKTAAEIAGIIGITDNTMKYHNKNIYSKLGISSRKQLLRFAALKQHQDRKEVVSK